MPSPRWIAALAAAMVGCNAIFGLDNLVVEPDAGSSGGTGGRGGGSSSTAGGGTGGAPCDGLCPEAQCCQGTCVDLGTSVHHCGQCGKACSTGLEACCSGACVDVTLDEANCGSCGVACPGTVCFGGQCTPACASPHEDCDKNIVLNGCEADLTSDIGNCGSCGIACPVGATCVAGACACPQGSLDCDGNPLNGCEADTQTDPLNCGACSQKCGANQACAAGACACAPGYDDCNAIPDDGCEVSLTTSTDCGACDNACGPNTICSMGTCACDGGFLDCTTDAGCESPVSSSSSCGACGIVCPAGEVCDGMACQSGCLPGQTLCGASCVELTTDPLHCGSCGAAVGANQTCVAGKPSCAPGYADCLPGSGCETSVDADAQNCGGCGIVCKPGALCVQGSCVCGASAPNDCGADCRVCCSDGDCADGLGCTTDVCAPDGMSCSHTPCAATTKCCSNIACAECCSDADCPAAHSCSGGVCSAGCPAGETLCDGQCVDTTSDPNNCNGCNIKCGSDGTCGCSAGVCSGGTVHFSEDFSDNFKGWTLEDTWEIGPATQSSGQLAGSPDPALDHSTTADNGVAGVLIGGNYPTAVAPKVSLVSPVIDLSGAAGTMKLTYFRWLNSGGGAPSSVRHEVDVFDGTTWKNVFTTSVVVTDSAWTHVEHNVTAWKNASFRVRFSYTVLAGGALGMSGWNLDDVTLSSTTCN